MSESQGELLSNGFMNDFPIPLEGDIQGFRNHRETHFVETAQQTTLRRLEQKLDRLAELLETSIHAGRVPVFYRDGIRWEAY